jgi:hypothetical protein
MTGPLRLRLDAADDLGSSWVTEVLTETALALGWAVDGPGRPDAVAVVVALGAAVVPVDEPHVVVRVEAGTPRSPAVEESPPHLPARLDLTVGAFRARRNQQVTRDAIERFLARVERTSPGRQVGAPGALDPAEAVVRADAAEIVAGNRALLAEVDAWLARTSMTPEAAQAIGADRAILDAAIGAPVLDLVIIERAAARLAAALAP